MMKKNDGNIEKRGKEALLSNLAAVPYLKVISTRNNLKFNNFEVDLAVEVKVRRKVFQVAIEFKTSGQPRIVRDAVNQMLRYKKELPKAVMILVAPFISEKAAAICREGGVGYVDLSGNCLITFDTVYIEKRGYPNQVKEKRKLRSLYSPKAERILRVLLANPGRKWKIQDLAEESAVSLGQVSNVKRQLYDREILSGARGGFSLIDPKALLDEWTDRYDAGKHILQEYYSLKGIGDTERELADWFYKKGISCALTGFSGAARVAPFVRYNRVMMYAASIPESELEALPLKPVNSGGNVRLYRPYDKGVFYGASFVGGIRIVSTVQLYLDLIGFRGRGEEAASALYGRIMENRW